MKSRSYLLVLLLTTLGVAHAIQDATPKAIKYQAECAPSKMGLAKHPLENTSGETLDEKSILDEIIKVRKEKDMAAKEPTLTNSLVDLARTLSAAACARYADLTRGTDPLNFAQNWSKNHQACFNLLNEDSKKRSYTLHSVGVAAIPPYFMPSSQDYYYRRTNLDVVADYNRIPIGKLMVRGYPEGNNYTHRIAAFSMKDKNSLFMGDTALSWSNREIRSPFKDDTNNELLLNSAEFLGVGCTPCDIRNLWTAQGGDRYALKIETQNQSARVKQLEGLDGNRLFLLPLEYERYFLMNEVGGEYPFKPYPEVIYCTVVGRFSGSK